MKDPFITLFLWELGSIVFLTIELYKVFHESFTLISDIDKYNQEGLLKSSRKMAIEISHNSLTSAIWYGSILTSVLNSIVIAFELLAPFIAIVSATVPILCWLIYRLIFHRFRSKIAVLKKNKNLIDKLTIAISNNLIYVAISMVLGQMWYFASQFSVERDVLDWSPYGLIPVAFGLIVGLIILNIASRVYPLKARWNRSLNDRWNRSLAGTKEYDKS